MMKIIASTTMLLFLLAGCNSENKQNKTISWEEYKNISDSILNSVAVNDRILFAEVGKEDYIQVNDLNSFNKDYLSFINVIDDDGMKIYIEVPYIESGDWNNEYIYVFEKSGMLKLFIRTSSFFNSICTEGILTEMEIFAYESDQLIKKEYRIYDNNNNTLEDTTNCIFNYRFEYPVYLNYYDLPVVKEYEDLFDK